MHHKYTADDGTTHTLSPAYYARLSAADKQAMAPQPVNQLAQAKRLALQMQQARADKTEAERDAKQQASRGAKQLGLDMLAGKAGTDGKPLNQTQEALRMAAQMQAGHAVQKEDALTVALEEALNVGS